MTTNTITRRGTSNGNERGSSYSRRSRRAWILITYASNIPGFTRCYRCGQLLFNPDDYPAGTTRAWPDWAPNDTLPAAPLTIDRIRPGCAGGTYKRENIRPACGHCNSETGGKLAGRKS